VEALTTDCRSAMVTSTCCRMLMSVDVAAIRAAFTSARRRAVYGFRMTRVIPGADRAGICRPSIRWKSKRAVIRVGFPAQLAHARSHRGPSVAQVSGAQRSRSVLDALEARYPMLRGRFVTGPRKNGAFVRFFACERDLSARDAGCGTSGPSQRSRIRCSSSAQWPAADAHTFLAEVEAAVDVQRWRG